MNLPFADFFNIQHSRNWSAESIVSTTFSIFKFHNSKFENIKTKSFYTSQLTKTYCYNHERKCLYPLLDFQTTNIKIRANKTAAIFY